jgi:hypothetical protein
VKDQLVFDTTNVDTIADSDHVGSHTLSGAGDLITSGDGDSDNLSTTAIEGLDVRSFLYGYDSVGDNWDRLQQSNGALKVFIDDGDFEVDVVINAEKDEDSAHSSGDTGNYVLAVRSDARPTNANTDADGDYASFFINANGELYVTDVDGLAKLTEIDTVLDNIKIDTGNIATDVAAIEVELLDQGTTLDSILSDTNAIVVDLAAIETELLDQGTTLDSIESELQGLSHAEDDVHVSGDQGIMSLAVRNDAGTALAADGDYIPLSTDSSGSLRVNVDNQITIQDAALANTAIAGGKTTLAVAGTSQDVVASPLSDRKYLYIYNKDNRKMFIGPSGVTAADGFPISPGSYIELRAGASVDIEAVSPKASHDVRYLELS